MGKPVTGPIIALTGQSLIKRDIRTGQPRFLEVSALLKEADICFTNYEGSIQGSYGGWPMKNGFVHVSSPDVLAVLKNLGFNALSLANNHAFDLGPPGILSTLETARNLNFLHAGIGENRSRAASPGSTVVNGQTFSLVAIDCSPLPDCFSALDGDDFRGDRPGLNRMRMIESIILPEELKNRLHQCSQLTGESRRNEAYQRVGFRAGKTGSSRFYGLELEAGQAVMEKRILHPEDVSYQLDVIRRTAARGDFVIVSFHHHYWEPDWEKPPGWAQGFFRACIDHGAHLVIGHGVPLLQGIEIYKGQPIFYSTGNFIFHSYRKSTYSNDALWKGVVAACTFGKHGKIETISLYPIILGGEEALGDHLLSRDTPLRCHGRAAADIITQLSLLSKPWGTTIRQENDVATITVSAQE